MEPMTSAKKIHKWWHELPLFGSTETRYIQKSTTCYKIGSITRRYSVRISKCWECKQWKGSYTDKNEMEHFEISWTSKDKFFDWAKEHGIEDCI